MHFEEKEGKPLTEIESKLNELFAIEKRGSFHLAAGLLFIQDRGVVTASELSGKDLTDDGKKTVEKLVEKGLIGEAKSELVSEKLLFDNLDSDVSEFAKLPRGVETYYELKYVAGYPDKVIPTMIKEIFSKYDRLKQLKIKGKSSMQLLATAFTLTCRGTYQCPINTNKYFKLAGGLCEVYDLGEAIGESLRYDPEARVKAYATKLQEKLGFDENSTQKFFDLWDKEKDKKVTVAPTYLAGLAYVASKTCSLNRTQREVADVFGVEEVSVRRHAREIADRQNLEEVLEFIPKKYRGEVRDVLNDISNNFKQKLNLPQNFNIDDSSAGAYHLQRARLDIASYLLANNHTKANPIHEVELTSKLSISEIVLHEAIGHLYPYSVSGASGYVQPLISPLNAGIVCTTISTQLYPRTHVLYVEDRKKAKKYVELMERVIQISEKLRMEELRNGKS